MKIAIISRSTIHADGQIYGPGARVDLDEIDVVNLEKSGREIGRVLCERVTSDAPAAPVPPKDPAPPHSGKGKKGYSGAIGAEGSAL